MLDMTENANNIIRNNVATKSSSEDYEKDILMSDIRNKERHVGCCGIYSYVPCISNTNRSVYSAVFKEGNIYGLLNHDSTNDSTYLPTR